MNYDFKKKIKRKLPSGERGTNKTNEPNIPRETHEISDVLFAFK